MTAVTVATLRQAMLAAIPVDGTPVGNIRLRDVLRVALGKEVPEALYNGAREALIREGILIKGQGRGGSVRLSVAAKGAVLTLETQEVPEDAKRSKPKQAGLPIGKRQVGQPTKAKAQGAESGEKLVAYQHKDHRTNNPEVGLVTPDDDPDQPKTTWAYDPHIDPALQFDSGRSQVENLIDDALASGDEAVMRAALEQLRKQAEPYLNWTGKAERTSFEVDTVSLHVHERIDPATILGRIRKQMQAGKKGEGSAQQQDDMFRAWFDQPLSYREAIEFYKHDRGWSNRLIAGDSLQVMNSLLQKESMAGQVQMIYIDPPYGIKYGSNFQPFVNKRDVKDRSDQDLTQEPEMIKAFRDTWELGIHSYLTYLRDRLLLAQELLHESGSVFVQISDQNLHHIRELLDEVFGKANFVSQISYSTTTGTADSLLGNEHDYLLWYSKDRARVKYRQLWLDKDVGDVKSYKFKIKTDRSMVQILSMQEKSGELQVDPGWNIAQLSFAVSQDPGSEKDRIYSYRGFQYDCGASRHWKTTNPVGLTRLGNAGRLIGLASQLNYVRLLEDYPLTPLTNVWSDTGSAGYSSQDPKRYVVQTDTSVIQRCLLMTTDPGDLVFDPTCGSGTTAFVSEKWGRRWITCDTSRVAITLAKQRLMTASYDYYEMKYPHEGLKAGFIYKTVPHVMLKSIANNSDIDTIYERDHPAIVVALENLNSLLKDGDEDFGIPRFHVASGGRAGQELSFAAGQGLLEWEVPFDIPSDWLPEPIRDWEERALPGQERELTGIETAFADFHEARQAMQLHMDASIAAHAESETLFDQPEVSKTRLRITGPFTMEAVPFPSVASLDEAENAKASEADTSIARSGESLRQHSYRDELMKSGIRGKNGQMLKFASLETMPELRYIHATGALADTGERVVVSFGPEYAALEQRQVEMAMREAETLFPQPKMIVFAAFTFDPEAAKDIDSKRGIVALKAQMNTDLLTEDLKKKQRGNQSFWLMGQPDVELRQLKDGHYQVEVHGFDYFDTVKGDLVSGGKGKIAMWSLDTDYDERSLFPSQVFFPMAGKKDGWEKLKKNIKAELDESLLPKLHGTVSLPFEAGDNRKVAVKIVDDRGIESLKVMALG